MSRREKPCDRIKESGREVIKISELGVRIKNLTQILVCSILRFVFRLAGINIQAALVN